MSERYGNAEPCDLSEYLFPPVLQDAATTALQAITQAPSLQQIREQLAQGLAVLDQLRDRPEVHTLDVHFARGLLTREADRQHGRVWPA